MHIHYASLPCSQSPLHWPQWKSWVNHTSHSLNCECQVLCPNVWKVSKTRERHGVFLAYLKSSETCSIFSIPSVRPYITIFRIHYWHITQFLFSISHLMPSFSATCKCFYLIPTLTQYFCFNSYSYFSMAFEVKEKCKIFALLFPCPEKKFPVAFR